MAGLGFGGYVAGRWADRRYAARPESLLATYGYFELGIGVLGFLVSLLLPRLGAVSATISSYAQDARGWYVLSTGAYLARYAIAVVVLAYRARYDPVDSTYHPRAAGSEEHTS